MYQVEYADGEIEYWDITPDEVIKELKRLHDVGSEVVKVTIVEGENI